MKRIHVAVSDLETGYNFNKTYLESLARKILLRVAKDRCDIELGIVFVEDGTIRKLNKRYKGHNRATDVLSFDLSDRNVSGGPLIGEIIISADTAARNASIFGTSFSSEIVLYIIHGILHLFGYDDEKIKDRLKMSRTQQRILGSLCANGNLSIVSMRR